MKNFFSRKFVFLTFQYKKVVIFMKKIKKDILKNAKGQQKVLLHEQMLGRSYNPNNKEDLNEML